MRQLYVARHKAAVSVTIGPDGMYYTRHNGRIRVDGADPHFAAAALADLGEIDELPGGLEVLEHGDALGCTVIIKKPEVPTEPPNGWTLPDDIVAATAAGRPTGQPGERGATVGSGDGCGSTVVYDPADWPRDGEARSITGPAILLRLLREANVNAAGERDPSIVHAME